jgi:hypothetical protein
VYGSLAFVLLRGKQPVVNVRQTHRGALSRCLHKKSTTAGVLNQKERKNQKTRVRKCLRKQREERFLLITFFDLNLSQV